MPRLDLLREAQRRAATPRGTRYAQRLLGPGADRPRAGRRASCALRRRLDGGGTARRRSARIAAARRPSRPSRVAGAGRRARWSRSAWPPTSRRSTCSRARSSRSAPRPTRDWVCVISDDCSRPERFAAMRARSSATTRASCSRARRGGSASTATSSARSRWRRARRALRRARRPGRPLAPRQARDAARRARRRAARLQRRADRRPRRRACSPTPTGASARNNHTDLLSLLVANAVTGAASLFRARAARRRAAVPARASSRTSTTTGSALVALALGDIAYVDRPLYDYVQHGDAALGHAAANRMPALRDRARPRCGATRASRVAAVAHALLRRRLPAAAVRDRARAALRRRGWRRPSAARSSASCAADRSLARAGAGCAARGARELAAAAARDARRRVDARATRSPGGGCWRADARATRPRAALRLDALPPAGAATAARRAARPAEPARARDAPRRSRRCELAVARRRAASGSTC